jgi:hypothetical protein
MAVFGRRDNMGKDQVAKEAGPYEMRGLEREFWLDSRRSGVTSLEAALLLASPETQPRRMMS